MGKSSPSPPPPPDYRGAAIEQGAANAETARLEGRMRNPNIYGPLGNQVVTFGANDQPTLTQSLTPAAAATLASQQNVQRQLADLGVTGIGKASGLLGTPFASTAPAVQTSLPTSGLPAAPTLDMSGLPAAPISPGTTAQQAITSRLEPDIVREQSALRNRLINQGLRPGGEAYDREMQIADRSATDRRLQAAAQGIGMDQAARSQALGERVTGGQFDQNRRNLAFNELVSGGQFGNTAAQQELARQLMLYQQPLNQITALMSGSQTQMPQFQGYQGSSVAPPPLFNATRDRGQADMDLYGINSSNTNAANAGLYSMLGAGLGAGITRYSDRRLKSNIIQVGTHPLGIGVYEYDIFGRRDVGVMADEVLEVRPEAVITHPSGYMMVNYGMLT